MQSEEDVSRKKAEIYISYEKDLIVEYYHQKT